MNSLQPAIWIVCAMGALIPLVTLGAGAITMWRRLASIYPDQSFEIAVSYRSVSARVGGTYLDGGSLWRVDIGASGLRLSLPQPFRRIFPPLFLPWSEIHQCQPIRCTRSAVGTKLTLARWPGPIYLVSWLWRNETLVATIQTRWREASSIRATPR